MKKKHEKYTDQQLRNMSQLLTNSELDLAIFGQCFQDTGRYLKILREERVSRSNKDTCKCGNQVVDESDFCKDCI